MKNLFVLLFIIVASNYLHSQNIMISNVGNPNEPSIMLDPKNVNRIVAGCNINGYFYSNDTGRTWTRSTLSSTYGVWGDPTIAVDTSSNFYFFHLSNPPSGSGNWIDRIICQKSTNNGVTWNNGTYTGLNGAKKQDKQWCAIDRKNNNLYITWTQFDNYGSSSPLDSSTILFSKSTDGGATWSAAKRINKKAGDCIDGDNTVEGAVPSVGPNGEIYVAWAGPDGLVFNKSTDQGNTWLSQETLVNTIPGGWDYSISGIDRCNGLPITTCDLSNGPNRGTIYINWSDQRNGVSNTDVWLVKSTNGGQTWSAPVKVNDDNSNKQQFFTWMTIDQANGDLYFVFYDRRNYADNNTDVYIAQSKDGGNTFINQKISEAPFVPVSSVFFGDYTNIVAHNGVIRPIWTRLNNGQLSIWTDLLKSSNITTATQNILLDESAGFKSFPNPSNNIVYVSYKLHSFAMVNLSCYNQEGQLVKTIIKNKKTGTGKYVETVDINKFKLKQGIYLLKLQIDNKIKTIQQVVVE
jgi:Secretion system C-terminal sorting domain